MVINKKEVGQRIFEIRTKNGYSMESFGRLIDNAPRGTVNSWEKGVNLPNKERISKIAVLGNMTTDELLYGRFEDYLSDLIKNRYNMRFPDAALTAIKKYAQQRELSYGDDIKIMELLDQMFTVEMLNNKPVNITYTPLDEKQNLYLGNMMEYNKLIPRYYIFADSAKNALHVLPYFLHEHARDFYNLPDFLIKPGMHTYFTGNFATVNLETENSVILYYGINMTEGSKELSILKFDKTKDCYELISEEDIQVEFYSKFLKELEKEVLYLT